MRCIRPTLVLAAAMGLAMVPGAGGQEDAPGFMAAKGRVTFRTYCASCHGTDGTGDGSIARYLKVEPADLTTIAERRGGVFPSEEITEYIDGRREARGHGSREMPVWGDVFQSPLSDSEPGAAEEPEARAQRKIRELVLYLESIQRQP